MDDVTEYRLSHLSLFHMEHDTKPISISGDALLGAISHELNCSQPARFPTKRAVVGTALITFAPQALFHVEQCAQLIDIRFLLRRCL